jgi:hypothetical protein
MTLRICIGPLPDPPIVWGFVPPERSAAGSPVRRRSARAGSPRRVRVDQVRVQRPVRKSTGRVATSTRATAGWPCHLSPRHWGVNVSKSGLAPGRRRSFNLRGSRPNRTAHPGLLRRQGAQRLPIRDIRTHSRAFTLSNPAKAIWPSADRTPKTRLSLSRTFALADLQVG